MKIYVNGRYFNTSEEFCNYYGISSQTVKSRLIKGLSYQEILNSIYSINIDGIIFRSYSDVARYFGVSESVLNSRLQRGKNLKESLIAKPFDIKDCDYSNKGITYNSRNFSSFSEIAYYYNIPFPLFAIEVNRTLSINRAIAIENKNYNRGIVRRNFPPRNSYNIAYNGKTYTSLKSLCEDIGSPYKSVSEKVSQGMSLKEAILTSGKRKRKKEIVLFGKKFLSVKDAFNYYSVDKNAIAYRVSKGMSIEEAILDIKKKV